jgi:hypothetical protein
MPTRPSRGLTPQEYARQADLKSLVKKGKIQPGDDRLTELKSLLGKMEQSQRPGSSARSESLIGVTPKKRGRPKGSKNKVNGNVATNATRPSVTSNPQDANEQPNFILLRGTKTVNGLTTQMQVEVPIPFEGVDWTVVQ